MGVMHLSSVQSAQFDRLDRPLAFALLGLWAAFALQTYWNSFPYDLSAIYFASYFFGTGGYDLLYAAPEGFFGEATTPAWLAEMARHGYHDELTFAYIYPPLWAALLGPLAANLEPSSFFNAIYVIHIAMIAGMILLWYRISKARLPLSVFVAIGVLICFTSSIVVVALIHNQPQITISFLVVFALERYLSGRQVSAGLLLGLAGAIKITPILLVLLFLLDGGRKAAAVAIATSAGLALLSLLLAGPDLHWQFVSQLQVVSSKIALMNVNYNLEVLFYEIAHLLTGDGSWLGKTPDGVFRHMVLEEPGWLKLPILASFVLFLGISYRTTCHLEQRDKLILQFAAMWIILSLCGPLGWNHYFVPIALMIPAMLRFLTPARYLLLLSLGLILFHETSFVYLAHLIPQIHAPAIAGALSFLAMLGMIWSIAARRSKTQQGAPGPARFTGQF